MSASLTFVGLVFSVFLFGLLNISLSLSDTAFSRMLCVACSSWYFLAVCFYEDSFF